MDPQQHAAPHRAASGGRHGAPCRAARKEARLDHMTERSAPADRPAQEIAEEEAEAGDRKKRLTGPPFVKRSAMARRVTKKARSERRPAPRSAAVAEPPSVGPGPAGLDRSMASSRCPNFRPDATARASTPYRGGSPCRREAINQDSAKLSVRHNMQLSRRQVPSPSGSEGQELPVGAR
jgi:hypothetical protein